MALKHNLPQSSGHGRHPQRAPRRSVFLARPGFAAIAVAGLGVIVVMVLARPWSGPWTVAVTVAVILGAVLLGGIGSRVRKPGRHSGKQPLSGFVRPLLSPLLVALPMSALVAVMIWLEEHG